MNPFSSERKRENKTFPFDKFLTKNFQIATHRNSFILISLNRRNGWNQFVNFVIENSTQKK